MAFAPKHARSSNAGKKLTMMNNRGQADVSPSNNHTDSNPKTTKHKAHANKTNFVKQTQNLNTRKKRKTDHQSNAFLTTDKTTLPNQYGLTKRKYGYLLNTATNSIHFLKPSSSEVDSCQQTCTRKFSISTRTFSFHAHKVHLKVRRLRTTVHEKKNPTCNYPHVV